MLASLAVGVVGGRDSSELCCFFQLNRRQPLRVYLEDEVATKSKGQQVLRDSSDCRVEVVEK